MKSRHWYERISPENGGSAERPKIRFMTPRERIAAHLKEYRKTWHMSQRQLAAKANTTQKVISLLEAGKYNPSIDLLTRIAEACNMRLDVSISPKGQ